MSLSVHEYASSDREHWNRFVERSKNGTFLFDRNYMDYHADRFEDRSVIVKNGDRTLALFPANKIEDRIYSHQGLTYGGLIVDERMTTPTAIDVLNAVTDHFRQGAAQDLYYKTVPHIYHRLPAEEDRYALFRAGATLYRRDVLSVVTPGSPGPVQTRRKRSREKATRSGVTPHESSDWQAFWEALRRS